MTRSELIYNIAKAIRPALFAPGVKFNEQRELLRRVAQFLKAAELCGMKFAHGDLENEEE